MGHFYIGNKSNRPAMYISGHWLGMSLIGYFKLKWRILIGQWVGGKLKKFYQKGVENPKSSMREEDIKRTQKEQSVVT